MTPSRRGFMGLILASCAAPAIVSSSSLMRVATPKLKLLSVDLAGCVTGHPLYTPYLSRSELKKTLYGALYGRPLKVPGLDVSTMHIPTLEAAFLESPAGFFDVYKELYVRSQ
jgi:hypothetical protein